MFGTALKHLAYTPFTSDADADCLSDRKLNPAPLIIKRNLSNVRRSVFCSFCSTRSLHLRFKKSVWRLAMPDDFLAFCMLRAKLSKQRIILPDVLLGLLQATKLRSKVIVQQVNVS